MDRHNNNTQDYSTNQGDDDVPSPIFLDIHGLPGGEEIGNVEEMLQAYFPEVDIPTENLPTTRTPSLESAELPELDTPGEQSTCNLHEQPRKDLSPERVSDDALSLDSTLIMGPRSSSPVFPETPTSSPITYEMQANPPISSPISSRTRGRRRRLAETSSTSSNEKPPSSTIAYSPPISSRTRAARRMLEDQTESTPGPSGLKSTHIEKTSSPKKKVRKDSSSDTNDDSNLS